MMLRCSCGSEKIFAVSPGAEDEVAEIELVVKRGRPDRVWCFDHWPQRPDQRDLFAVDPVP